MLNKSEDKKIYINEPNKSVRLGRFIGPFLLYYMMTIVAQVLWGVWALPKVLKEFIQVNDGLMMKMPEGYESLEFLDIMYEFMKIVDDEAYLDFLYALTDNAIENIAVITVLSAFIAIPFFISMMNRDRKKNRVYVFDKKIRWKTMRYGWIILGSVVLCVALNNLIALTNLAQMSESYEETSQALYSISLPLQLVGLAVIVPIFEELLYRGVIYNRLKVNLPKYSSIGISAFLFGTMHGNLVQMLYAFILGIVFAWLYEVYKSIWAPIIAHMFMNLTSVIFSESNLFDWIYAEPVRMGVVTVLSATLSATVYVIIANKISADIAVE